MEDKKSLGADRIQVQMFRNKRETILKKHKISGKLTQACPSQSLTGHCVKITRTQMHHHGTWHCGTGHHGTGHWTLWYRSLWHCPPPACENASVRAQNLPQATTVHVKMSPPVPSCDGMKASHLKRTRRKGFGKQ